MEGWKLPGNNLTNLTHFRRFSFEYLPKVFLIDFFFIDLVLFMEVFLLSPCKVTFFLYLSPGAVFARSNANPSYWYYCLLSFLPPLSFI